MCFYDDISSLNSSKLVDVMHDELNFLNKNKTWILIDKPKEI